MLHCGLSTSRGLVCASRIRRQRECAAVIPSVPSCVFVVCCQCCRCPVVVCCPTRQHIPMFHGATCSCSVLRMRDDRRHRSLLQG
jgi:hypothetical protein